MKNMNIFTSLKRQKLESRKEVSCHEGLFVLQDEKVPLVYYSTLSPSGTPLELLVKVGDEVKIGTMLARRKDFYVPVYASVSGVIKGMVKKFDPSVGRDVDHLEIENNFKNETDYRLNKYSFSSSPAELVAGLRESGLVGLGGAGFPTYFKYENSKNIDTLLINGVECEPCLSTDYKMIELHGEEIVKGVELLRLAAQANVAIIAIKVGKKVLEEKINGLIANYPALKLKLVPDAYPMGWERTLIKQVTGRTYDKLPSEAHVIVNNISTAYGACRVLLHGEPLTKRIVTLSGNGLVSEVNILAPLGTPITTLVEVVGGYAKEEVTAFAGGPMSSKALSNDNFVTTLPMGGYTVIAPQTHEENPCLRCGACTSNCPANIQPIEIKLANDSNNTDRLLKLDVMRCIDCGLCSYVCPSKIEVYDAVRKAKLKVRIALAKASNAAKK